MEPSSEKSAYARWNYWARSGDSFRYCIMTGARPIYPFCRVTFQGGSARQWHVAVITWDYQSTFDGWQRSRNRREWLQHTSTEYYTHHYDRHSTESEFYWCITHVLSVFRHNHLFGKEKRSPENPLSRIQEAEISPIKNNHQFSPILKINMARGRHLIAQAGYFRQRP